MKKIKLCIVILSFVSFSYAMENKEAEMAINGPTEKKEKKRKRPVLNQANTNNKRTKTVREKVQYKCDQCDYSSAFKWALTRHIRTHTGERPYKCDQCDKSFVCKSSLTRHIITHIKEKLYKCDRCDYSFACKSALTIHLKTHSGLLKYFPTEKKPYKCGHCDYESKLKSTLTNHIRIHIGEKLYKCDQCDYASLRNTDLKQHIIRSHTKKEINTTVSEAQAILNQESDLNIQNKNELAVLVEGNNSSMLEMLLDNDKICYNFQSQNGNTILMDASMSGNIELVTAILSIEETNPNIQNNKGDTALILAAKAGHVDVVKALLADQRINITITNNNGDTTLIIAENAGYEDIVRLISDLESRSRASQNIQTTESFDLFLKALGCARYIK